MRPRVKICGITRVTDAIAAAEAGADFLGYIFYAPSKRFIAPRAAKEIVLKIRQLHPHVQHVGVFVDETEENMIWTRALVGLDFLQLHGAEKPETCSALAAVGAEVIKVLPCSNGIWTVDALQYSVPFYLCDSHDPVTKGGTGRRFDLSLIPSDIALSKMFIAGGITPDNVRSILAQVVPYGFDVSSGVEDLPGVKNHQQIAKLIANVRAAADNK